MAMPMLANFVPPLDFASPAKSKHVLKKSTTTTDLAIDPVARTTISLEFASLGHRDHCPLGIYILPSPDTITVWDGTFFVHQGYFADAVFKFRLTFPPTYPDSPPQVKFTSDVFHPLVSPNSGTFNLAPRFRPWRPKEHRVFDVLHWIKAAFKKHALDEIKEVDCLNKEAFRYHESTSSFANLASQSSLLSQSAPALFDQGRTTSKGTPRDALTFVELTPAQLAAQRSRMGLKEWDVSEQP
uniref:UBC-like protein n=1 Tax=Mycena chlorophos TaxID=658473 RepID=A0ABQ0M7X9_MYCCL|nr:UBC-like protein [Mycena chlorophos]